jgi:hypothetical protein
MPPKKRGRPPKTLGPARPVSPTFNPVFSKPRMPPDSRLVQSSEDDVQPAPAFLNLLPPDILGAESPSPPPSPSFLDLLPPAILGGDSPPPALAGPSSEVRVINQSL